MQARSKQLALATAARRRLLNCCVALLALACDKTPPERPARAPERKAAPSAATTTAPASLPPAPPRAPSTTPEPSWTAGIIKRASTARGSVRLRQVRVAAHAGFDRTVFELEGPELPGFHLEYIDRPVRRCGSGDTATIAGDGWLQVSLEPAEAHDDQGHATVHDRSQKPALPNVQQLELTCDFEGQVVWVLGVQSPNPYRVLTLTQPTRLVVDVAHQRRPDAQLPR
ncbi:MAG TPA: hypothetical protein VER33_11780 [Polyangiaceae bacterium]|nr:hypothetical protein [Polyangiaceae bacterium]